jgi:hypothetical protein
MYIMYIQYIVFTSNFSSVKPNENELQPALLKLGLLLLFQRFHAETRAFTVISAFSC